MEQLNVLIHEKKAKKRIGKSAKMEKEFHVYMKKALIEKKLSKAKKELL